MKIMVYLFASHMEFSNIFFYSKKYFYFAITEFSKKICINNFHIYFLPTSPYLLLRYIRRRFSLNFKLSFVCYLLYIFVSFYTQHNFPTIQSFQRIVATLFFKVFQHKWIAFINSVSLSIWPTVRLSIFEM